MCLEKIMIPISSAPIEAINTAPAERSLICLMCSSFSIETLLQSSSMAVLRASNDRTLVEQKIIQIQSSLAILNIKPREILKSSNDNCILKLLPSSKLNFNPLKAKWRLFRNRFMH